MLQSFNLLLTANYFTIKKNDEKQGAISNQNVIEKNLFLGQQVGHMVFSLLSDLRLRNFTGKINEVSDFNSYLVS